MLIFFTVYHSAYIFHCKYLYTQYPNKPIKTQCGIIYSLNFVRVKNKCAVCSKLQRIFEFSWILKKFSFFCRINLGCAQNTKWIPQLCVCSLCLLLLNFSFSLHPFCQRLNWNRINDCKKKKNQTRKTLELNC